MGDHIPLGGFQMASAFVNWDFYHQQDKSWVNQRQNEATWAPNPNAVRRPNPEPHLWSSDEEQWDNDLFGTGILSPTAQDDLTEIRRSVIRAQRRRLDFRLGRQEPQEITSTDEEEGSQGRVVQDEVCNNSHNGKSSQRKPTRKRRPKRHFDEIE